MERQFYINWPAIIEEAKQRRKAENLTQSRLAEMAKVSTPTISRFENGEKDIQLSTIIRILSILGMNDPRNLFFDKEIKPRRINGNITITGQDGKKIIQCAISDEVLDDHFNSGEKNYLTCFQNNRDRIEHEIRRKYLADKFEIDGSILLRTADIV